MNCFQNILNGVGRRRRDARVSWTEVTAARLQHLLQHLTVRGHPSTHSTMGNTSSSAGAGSGQGGAQVGPNKGQHPTEEPPDYLVKLLQVLQERSQQEDSVGEGISEGVFIKYICKGNECLGQRLYHYLLRHWPGEVGTLVTHEAFLAGGNYILSLLGDSQQLQFYIKVMAEEEDKISKGEVYELVLSAHHLSSLAHRTCCPPDDILPAVVEGAMHGKENVSTKYLHSWLMQHCPRLGLWLHRSLTHTLTVGHSTILHNTTEKEDNKDTPILDCASKSSFAGLHPALIWLLSCTLPLIYTKQQQKSAPSANNLLDPHIFIDRVMASMSPTHWQPLYNSDHHGLSINRFQHHVFSYHSPTLTFLTVEGGNTFCIACDQTWRDSKHFWGGDTCLCVHLTPQYKIIESGANMIYFNVSSRGFPTGIQVGVDSTNRALTLNLDLTLLTYRKIPFKLQSIEVWGCGTTEAKEAQLEMKKREVRDVEQRRKVKLNTSDWQDNPDRYLIELAGTRLSYAQYDGSSPGGASTK